MKTKTACLILIGLFIVGGLLGLADESNAVTPLPTVKVLIEIPTAALTLRLTATITPTTVVVKPAATTVLVIKATDAPIITTSAEVPNVI